MRLAGQTLPTLCEFISEIEVLMTEWETMAKDHSETADAIENGLKKIIEYYTRMDKCTAYTIDMCKPLLASKAWYLLINLQSCIQLIVSGGFRITGAKNMLQMRRNSFLTR